MNDLCQLRHFVALAEHQHFARAAAAVHLSQPALSRSIQALESQLDCTLVDRHSRGVSRTAHGHLVLEHARRLLAGSLALSNAVHQLGNLEAGELRLGAGPYPAARLIPQALGQLLQRLKLDIANWLELRDSLLDSAIELFVADIRELQDDAQLHIEPLRVHQGVLFCRPAHPLLQRRNLQLRDLLDFPLAGTQLPQVVERSLGQASGRAQPLSVQCDNFLVLKRLVADSDVLSMAPWDVIAGEVESGQLALLPLLPQGLHQHSAYGLVSRAGHSLSPAAQAMVTAIHLVGEQTPRAGHAAD
ncbi:LysR family transcriptional regulator [Ectopseudomonas chengduensis]|nr:LysR family transcriptional regulator [Pseudomonas sp. WS 5019]NMY16895.1 LysR family transcriptional regulator [Pseudomonas sp. WS 5019]